MEESMAVFVCSFCGKEQPPQFKFCSNCGKRNSNTTHREHIAEKTFRKNLRSIVLYSILSIVLLLIMAFTEDSFEILVFWTVSFAAIDLLFAADQPSVYGLFRLRGINIFPILSIVAICIFSGFLVSYSMDRLNMILFQETEEIMDLFKSQSHPLLYSIIIIAVFPAIFEELAFRGFVFNNFKFLGGTRSAFWGSSFLFALVHFSLLSLVWLLPFGLLLSYYRNRYSTVLYGMLGHFTHNTTSLLIEHYGLI